MDYRDEKRGDEIYSKFIKAGKRTYFFDVKETKTKEKYIVITESKKVFNEEDGSFDYDKHKIFLYKEDYDKFLRTLDNMIEFIKTGIPLREEIQMRKHNNQSEPEDLKY